MKILQEIEKLKKDELKKRIAWRLAYEVNIAAYNSDEPELDEYSARRDADNYLYDYLEIADEIIAMVNGSQR